MKVFVLIIAALLLTRTISRSQDRLHPGDTVYCWAKNGLSLRIEPLKSSSKIALIPFGKSCEVIDIATSHFYSDTLIKDKVNPILITGFWQKVKYEKDTGYVFNGYLSKYDKNTPYFYFNDRIDAVITTHDTTLHWAEYTFEASYVLTKLPNGSFHKMIFQDGGWEDQYYIPDLTKEEAILMLREYIEFDEYCDFKVVEYSADKIEFESCMLTFGITMIRFKDSWLLVTMSGT